MPANMNQLSQPKYRVKAEKNVFVRMRDNIRIAVDLYRPDTSGKFPALLSMSPYSKDLQKLPIPRFPTDEKMANGGIESGDTEYFVSRGYIHVIADDRGTGFSEGGYRVFAKAEQQDGYDLVEWIAAQPWCNGNVGMLGMSYFAMIQYLVAAQQPPHLKAIFPHDGCTDIYRSFAYHGGIMNRDFAYYWWPQVIAHTYEPSEIPSSELQHIIEQAKNNSDARRCPSVYSPLIVPQKNIYQFDILIHPNDGPYYWERSAYTKFDKIKVPTYLLSRWNGHSIHMPGAFSGYVGINAPKKLRIEVPESGVGYDRPWHENHEIILRWYDHWLKGIDTGIMSEPPISIFVQGLNKWRYENEWPLARTKWTKFFLREGNSLSLEPPASDESSDSFIYKPGLLPGQKVPCITYSTPSLNVDTEITGPSAFYFYAALSKENANWHIEMYDISPDASKRLITMGWLKASHREVDQSRSKPYQPFHPHIQDITTQPMSINEYAIDLKETSNVFKAGHKILLIVKGQDTYWEGPEYFRQIHGHLEYSQESEQTVYHTNKYQSYLLLPVIS